MVPGTLKPLFQGTIAAAKEILIRRKSIVHPLLVESSLTLAAKLVSGKPFCVKEFQKTRSLIISQPRENGLAGA